MWRINNFLKHLAKAHHNHIRACERRWLQRIEKMDLSLGTALPLSYVKQKCLFWATVAFRHDTTCFATF